MTNTKERHQEIYNAAVLALKEAGGVEVIDEMARISRLSKLREMALAVAGKTNCARDTARRNVAKALRRARYDIMLDRWGGSRCNQTGRPPLPKDQKRQRVSTRLAPGSKELAQAIAKILELPGWGHVLDQALVKMVEGDQELKAKLANLLRTIDETGHIIPRIKEN